ncbi:radical SAM/CxCxxxxC motif protein YfkAB [Symbiobacterium thermophilum]|uniref:Radical SAM/CxCxxxxC motif protein YfkAB n=1 Tax=Symbiobacterium thermophilum TaxID=2734 RepID=A0A953LHU7_SYMTR|nr:radical SAM/CxCxxxxC motif protein YfkAB [Symbiobacterium thermophilum]MBY6275314.1 radical SAM/CxCxxxxC motif protein YfkAB [Symbiobacterium thermophilum]
MGEWGFIADPWEPRRGMEDGRFRLTSVEITVTNWCNLRCRHCAVGESLMDRDPERLPLDLILRRLDEVEGLTTLSLTGGELSGSTEVLRRWVAPLLQYAKRRGLQTQVNTNLTFDLGRYEEIAPWVDVFHITWNYRDKAHFHRIVWGHGSREVSPEASRRLFQRIIDNARALAAQGRFVSAETMINAETADHLGAMNRFLAEIGCRRHEVHPMYAVDWASDLPVLPLPAFREAIRRFLAERDPNLWVLFGTFPFLPCSPLPEDQDLLRAVAAAPNVSVRNCPDGRNRVNVDLFTGAVRVTDFGGMEPLGNVRTDRLEDAFRRWHAHPRFQRLNCHCPEVGCTGPDLLVAEMYYPEVDFRTRRAVLPTGA